MKGEAIARVRRQQAIAANNRGEDKRPLINVKKEAGKIMDLNRYAGTYGGYIEIKPKKANWHWWA